MSEAASHGALLLAEDDVIFSAVLARALRRRGFAVVGAANAADALAAARTQRPPYAVIDLKLGADNGLALIPQLRAAVPDMRILLRDVFTGKAL